MWLTRNMYKKLPTDVKFELPPIDSADLQARYAAFEKDLNTREPSSPVEASKLN